MIVIVPRKLGLNSWVLGCDVGRRLNLAGKLVGHCIFNLEIVCRN